mgnify:CR=1 FL=1
MCHILGVAPGIEANHMWLLKSKSAQVSVFSSFSHFRVVMFSIFSQDALSRGQLLRLCFSRAVVKVWQAVKVWPLHGPNPSKFHL